MRFYVPQLSLMNSLDFENSLPVTIPDEEFILDFSRMTNFEPLPMLMTGSIIRRYRSDNPDVKFSMDGCNGKGKDYAGTMGFFKYISPLLKLGKMPGEANGNKNYLPITPLIVGELQQAEYDKGNLMSIGNLIEKEASRLARIIDRGNAELHEILTYLIREILRNTPEHSESDRMWICGQYWPYHNWAEISIIDEGIGIYNSITKNPAHRNYIDANSTALKWALKAGVSQAIAPSKRQRSNDEWANSGFGLYMVSEICKQLQGSFCIISGDSFLLKNEHDTREGKASFDGTAIRICVTPDCITSAKDIIALIADQGEREAKTIRNAFKKASIPSKGLMESLNVK